MSLKTHSRESWIGWFSSFMEAYNMSIYLFAAPLLAGKIFRGESDWSAIFFSYCLLLVGAGIFYPLGALYYGWLGDKEGRRHICTSSTLGLALVTGALGLIPFRLLGDHTWLIFLCFLCAQYFFSGGEYHGSIVFSLEHSSEQQGGLSSAFSCLFAVFGLLAANGSTLLASSLQTDLWIRWAFLLGFIGGVMSYILKNYCRETPVFTTFSSSPLKEATWRIFIQQEWWTLGRVISILAFFIVIYSFIFIFLPLVASTQSFHPSFHTFWSLIVYGIFLVLAGYLADQWGIEAIMEIGCCLLLVIILPLFYFCSNLFICQTILTVCACFVIGPIHSWMLQQFAPQKRCRGIFISSAIATSLFGGSTVPICLWLFAWSGSLVVCSLYPFFIACGSSICLLYSLRILNNNQALSK